MTSLFSGARSSPAPGFLSDAQQSADRDHFPASDEDLTFTANPTKKTQQNVSHNEPAASAPSTQRGILPPGSSTRLLICVRQYLECFQRGHSTVRRRVTFLSLLSNLVSLMFKKKQAEHQSVDL